MSQYSPSHLAPAAGRPQPPRWWPTRRARAALVLLAVAVVLGVVVVALTTWVCTGTYVCPAAGCGAAPPLSCAGAVAWVPLVAFTSVLVGVGGLILVVRSRAPYRVPVYIGGRRTWDR